MREDEVLKKVVFRKLHGMVRHIKELHIHRSDYMTCEFLDVIDPLWASRPTAPISLAQPCRIHLHFDDLDVHTYSDAPYDYDAHVPEGPPPECDTGTCRIERSVNDLGQHGYVICTLQSMCEKVKWAKSHVLMAMMPHVTRIQIDYFGSESSLHAHRVLTHATSLTTLHVIEGNSMCDQFFQTLDTCCPSLTDVAMVIYSSQVHLVSGLASRLIALDVCVEDEPIGKVDNRALYTFGRQLKVCRHLIIRMSHSQWYCFAPHVRRVEIDMSSIDSWDHSKATQMLLFGTCFATILYESFTAPDHSVASADEIVVCSPKLHTLRINDCEMTDAKIALLIGHFRHSFSVLRKLIFKTCKFAAVRNAAVWARFTHLTAVRMYKCGKNSTTHDHFRSRMLFT